MNTTQMPPFQREARYIVIKRKHLSEAQERDLCEGMRLRGIGTVECVVVESDWPEYEAVWAMIEARVTGRSDTLEKRRLAAIALIEDASGDMYWAAEYGRSFDTGKLVDDIIAALGGSHD